MPKKDSIKSELGEMGAEKKHRCYSFMEAGLLGAHAVLALKL